MRILFLTLFFFNMYCLPAMAYIDPGMFSLFLTYIVSGIVGAYIVFKNQIKELLKKMKNLKDKNREK